MELRYEICVYYRFIIKDTNIYEINKNYFFYML